MIEHGHHCNASQDVADQGRGEEAGDEIPPRRLAAFDELEHVNQSGDDVGNAAEPTTQVMMMKGRGASAAGRSQTISAMSQPAKTPSGPWFSAFLYRHRNVVERFFRKLKHFRAVAIRFEKHSQNYLALVKLASAKISMRSTSR